MKSGFRAALLGAALVAAGTTEAAARPLEAVTLDPKKTRIDGLLREWPSGLDALGETVRGNAKDGDPAVRGAIGADAKNLYVAFEVKDDRLVRTAAMGENEDHGTLILAFPRAGGGWATYTLSLYPGQPGRSAAGVKMAGAGKVPGVKVVEAPMEGGYMLEASIPWSTFPEARRLRAGIRAALRYSDADKNGAVRAVVGTSRAAAGAALQPLLLEAEQGLFHSLIAQKGAPQKASRVVVGDIAGDSMQEVIALYGPYLTVVGSAYRGGKEFFFQELGVTEGAAVLDLDARDLTGDGKDEIVIRKRVGSRDEHREVLQVLSVPEDSDAPFTAFEHEVGVVTSDVSIKNEVSFKRKGKFVDIVISQGKTKDVDVETYAEPEPANMPGALLPWQRVKSRTFRWNEQKFEKTGEQAWEPPVAKPKAQAKTRKSSPAPAAIPATHAMPAGPPPPRPPNAEELMDRVYALYRKDRRVGRGKARFDFVTDVAADRTSERVVIHDRDIVVFGKAFKGGLSYVYITIGVDNAEDLMDVTARDLTGDGKAEVIVRAVLHVEPSEQFGTDIVDRHALFVYQVTEESIRRIFAAETGRSVGGKTIVGGVRFVPSRRGVSLELRPARAIGWTEKSYPFPAERQASGGLEPLLLPWGDGSPRRYRFNGSAYVLD